jgi:hypothetical protein
LTGSFLPPVGSTLLNSNGLIFITNFPGLSQSNGRLTELENGTLTTSGVPFRSRFVVRWRFAMWCLLMVSSAKAARLFLELSTAPNAGSPGRNHTQSLRGYVRSRILFDEQNDQPRLKFKEQNTFWRRQLHVRFL